MSDHDIPGVAELWRYPVKSLLGERLASLDLVADGVGGTGCGASRTLSTPVS